MFVPHNIEAEQSVLGSMLLDNSLIDDITTSLSKDDFYKPEHQDLFTAIMSLNDKRIPADLTTLNETMDISYMAEIMSNVPTTANVKHYAEIVKEKSKLRKLMKISDNILSQCQEEPDVEKIIDYAEMAILEINQSQMQEVTSLKECLMDSIPKIEQRYRNKNTIIGLPSGFTDLDYKTAGFQNSDLILIAARPAMGKSALALNIAENVTINKKKPVIMFNLEMSKDQLTNRILSSQLHMDSQKLKIGSLSDDDWDRIGKTAGVISFAPLFIDDTPIIKVSEMRSKARRVFQKYGKGLIIIDYLQLMTGSGKENRQQDISDISRNLKIMAKELDIPVIALSQLSRAVESRKDQIPMLSDLRESGAIEQDADLVMFVYREDYYKADSTKKNIADIIIAKHRSGGTGTIELRWFPEFTKFGNLRRDQK